MPETRYIPILGYRTGPTIRQSEALKMANNAAQQQSLNRKCCHRYIGSHFILSLALGPYDPVWNGSDSAGHKPDSFLVHLL